MTLKIETVGYAKYRQDDSIAFYVRCKGISETVETSIQQGAENEYNNSVLQTWLKTNTPDSYSTAISGAQDAVANYLVANSSIIDKPANVVAAMTDAQKTEYNAALETCRTELLSLSNAQANAISVETASLLEKEKVFD
jgi:hypothetical protein